MCLTDPGQNALVFASSLVVLAYEPRPTSVDAGGKGLIDIEKGITKE
jgi:hypothetical protein